MNEKVARTAETVIIDNYDGYAAMGRPVRQTFKDIPVQALAVCESVVDNLIFLGLEKNVAAVASCPVDTNNPDTEVYQQFQHLTKGKKYPSKEAVLAFRPDLIICWGSLFGDSTLGSVDYWHKKGIKTYLLSNTVPVTGSGARTLRNIIKDLRNLAKIFRLNGEQIERIDNLETRIDELERARKSLPADRRPKVITVQYVYGNEYHGRTSSDLTSDIIIQAGGISLDDKTGGKKSIEYLLKKNPDIIMIVDMPTRPGKTKVEALKRNPLLRHVTAVKKENFFLIPYRAFYGGSVHTIEITEELHNYIKQHF